MAVEADNYRILFEKKNNNIAQFNSSRYSWISDLNVTLYVWYLL
jgi:hypothetical protein